jgi:hypothetical protein
MLGIFFNKFWFLTMSKGGDNVQEAHCMQSSPIGIGGTGIIPNGIGKNAPRMHAFPAQENEERNRDQVHQEA